MKRLLVMISVLFLTVWIVAACGGDDSGGGGACDQLQACCDSLPAGSKGACGPVIGTKDASSCNKLLDSYKQAGACN